MIIKFLVLIIIVVMSKEDTSLASGLSNLRVKDMDSMMMVYDFTKIQSLDGWEEQSDTVREVGKSNGILVLQKTQVFQRAVFFSMLNPQPNGACFAGYRTKTQLNLSAYKALELWTRGQGQNFGYKINLRHKGLNDEPNPTYEHMFQAPKDDFGSVRLELSDFEPYFRGRKLNVSEVGTLDTSNITNFEIQIYGGVYLPIKQAGTSSLEIDWVKAVQ